MNRQRILRVLVSTALMVVAAAPAFAQENTPIGNNSWFWKFGLDERLRLEYKKDFDFNEGRKDNGSLFFHRLKLNATIGLKDADGKDRAFVFVEGLDAQTGGYRIKAQANQTDDFDLHQAYLQIFDFLGSDFDIKAGRAELKYGNGRLIAQPSWSNRIRAFDTGVLRYEKSGVYTDLFIAQDVKYDDNNFNRSSGEEFIGGVYGGYQKEKPSALYEGYFLPQIITSGANTIERYTVGTRLKGSLPQEISWEVEFPYQFGTTGPKDIKAHALHASLSKTCPAFAGKPKFSLEYNHATGDRDPNDSVTNTFNPLYQSTHDSYGILDFFRWQNMREAAANVQIAPSAKWKVTPQVNFFWLESKSDSWYNSSGTVLRSKLTGDRGYYVGNEASLRLSYDFHKNLKWEAGYAHFFPGGYVKDTGARDDADWLYSQVNLKY